MDLYNQEKHIQYNNNYRIFNKVFLVVRISAYYLCWKESPIPQYFKSISYKERAHKQYTGEEEHVWNSFTPGRQYPPFVFAEIWVDSIKPRRVQCLCDIFW